MWVVLPALALAGTEIVLVDGPLRPGRAAVLEAAATTDTGAPRASPPRIEVAGGAIREATAVRPGVWRWSLTPAIDTEQVEVGLDGVVRVLPVAPPPRSALRVPELVDVTIGAGEVVFVVADPVGSSPSGVPPAEAIEVVPAEGQVVSVTPTAQGLEVRVALEDRPHPRWVPIAVRDRRRDEQPAWVDVRVRARPRLPIVAEPGAKLTLEVGQRSYGPIEAGPDGQIEARIDQYPADLSATAILVDDLGNETRTEVPLVGQAGPTLLATVSGELLPGRPTPLVYVRAVNPDGSAPRSAPGCRTPSGSLPSRSLGDGTWLVPLPSPDEPLDLRVACSLGAEGAEVRVPVASGVPVRLGLRVWPDELLADFPVAEVSVVLDDARGERVPIAGVEVRADHGAVALEETSGIVARGEYDGAAALEVGEDRVEARYVAPAGSGPVEELVLGWGAVPRAGGELVVHARALDRLRRPLSGVPITLRLQGEASGRDDSGQREVVASTGEGGWASAALPWAGPDRPGPRSAPAAIEATSGRAAVGSVVLPGDPAVGGPGEPDLRAIQQVHVRPGRVSGISIAVEPSILRAGPGAVAWVFVRLEDGAGQPVTDEPVELEASEGEVGELRIRPDGTWVAEYTPVAAEQARQVEITARTSTVRSTAHLVLEPRVVRVAVGPWLGGQTNFGALSAPAAGFDLDFRLRSRLVGESVILRVGGSATSFRSEALTGVGPPVDLRSTQVPLTAAVLLRQDRGPLAVWGGAGALVGPQFVQVRFGDQLVAQGQSWLVGPVLTGGVGMRAPGGEVVLTVQGSWVPATRADVGYSGNLGGLSGGLGYRLVY